MLSDLHFDPYSDPAIMEELGAKLLPGCGAPAAASYSRFGSDTNYPLLKSTLENVTAMAATNHIHYDYAIITGDFLVHDFDTTYRKCVGGGAESYRKFARDTLGFVDREIAKALPGVPTFAALGNNDSDQGDYAEPSDSFLQDVGRDWSHAWGKFPPAAREKALASFTRAGNYAVPSPVTPKHDFVILNSNLWVARNTQACSDADPDPRGQFQWLVQVLGDVKRAGGTASLVLHILPGVDAMKSSLGAPRLLWTDRCTQRFIAVLSDFRGVVDGMYAGHIHRDDFRLLPDREGHPLLSIHVVPSVSPVYLNNPAVEIGWYDRKNGELRDYAPFYLDLTSPQPAWAMEYVFSQAYGRGQVNLDVIGELSRAIQQHSSQSGVGKSYARYYAAGAPSLLTPDNWLTYTCTQTEMTLSDYAHCKLAGAGPHP